MCCSRCRLRARSEDEKCTEGFLEELIVQPALIWMDFTQRLRRAFLAFPAFPAILPCQFCPLPLFRICTLIKFSLSKMLFPELKDRTIAADLIPILRERKARLIAKMADFLVLPSCWSCTGIFQSGHIGGCTRKRSFR